MGQEDVYITVIVSYVLLLTPCKYDMTIWQAHTKGVPDFSQSSFNERPGQARPFCRHFDQFQPVQGCMEGLGQQATCLKQVVYTCILCCAVYE